MPTIHSTSVGFESNLDALPGCDVPHTTLVDLLPLPRSLNNLLDVHLRDADDTVYVSNNIVPWMNRHSREDLLGTLWVDLEGNVYRGWTHKGRLAEGRATSRKNRIPEGIVFLDVPTATGDHHPECFAGLCAGRHEPTPDRVLPGYGGGLVNSRITFKGGQTELGGALITITVPAGAVSIKCEESFGALVSEENTISTVYAGPQIVWLDREGETSWMSGMWPPLGEPSLISASDISQAENSESCWTRDSGEVEDMVVDFEV